MQRALTRIGAAIVAVAVLAALAACSPPNPKVHITPTSAFFTEPFAVTVTGAPAGDRVVLRLTTTSRTGAVWSSSATWRADSRGSLGTATAPVSGDYTGARPMGLVDALHPEHGDATTAFAFPADGAWRMTVTALDGGRTLGSATTVRRGCASAVRTVDLRPRADGVFGELTTPLHRAAGTRPGVVVIGGSEGGLATGTQACALAAAGYPSLALAYFAEPGLPADLQRIPLEYVDRAARILARAAGVDPHRVVLWGDSRGSEAAMLTGAAFPMDVGAVVATVPSSVANPGLPLIYGVPAWTLHGRAVPTAFDFTASPDSPAAIRVERLAGPLLVMCAGRDDVWRSCAYSDDIRQRIAERRSAVRLTTLRYPAAGHFAGTLVPYLPSVTVATIATGTAVASGGSRLASAEAREDGWRALLGWLGRLPH